MARKQGEPIYRVSHGGANEQNVTASDHKTAAERYVAKFKPQGGFICAKDGSGREKRFLLRSPKRAGA